jgi:FHA domain
VKITSCVPLAGEGVIARNGALIAVTDGRGPDPDPLLNALADAAASGGDGGDLVLRAARAALGGHGRPAWACAGATADGGVAVLVHGHAMITVRVDGGPDVTLTASDSVIPVSRKFAGATVALSLAVGDPAAPDPQFWLGDGVVRGGGLAVTMTADTGDMGMRTPTAASPAVMSGVAPTVVEMDAAGDGPQAVMVDGVPCARDHFNDPAARACRQCGAGLDQPPRNIQRRPRPPLGLLVLDDGTRFTLDGDYVVGREPTFDSDVIDGRARPLRINDPNGTVSRLHLRISLVGWLVEVSDLGSANGSLLQSSGVERSLAPFEPTVIEPSARICIGHRSMQYLAYQGVLP